MGTCEVAAGATGRLCGASAGGVGGVGGEVWANATEVSASPRAMIRREAGMFIGDTSARHKANGVPFIENHQNPSIAASLRLRDTNSIFTLSAIPSAYVRIAYSRVSYHRRCEPVIPITGVNIGHAHRWPPS